MRPRADLEASIRRLTNELSFRPPCAAGYGTGGCVGDPCPIGRLKTSASCFDENGECCREDAFYAECWRRWSNTEMGD